MTYLLRLPLGNGKRRIYVAPDFYARREYKRRVVRELGWGGREVAETHQPDHRFLRIHVGGKAGPAMLDRGQPSDRGESVHVEQTAAGVKEALRRVRTEEQVEIDAAVARVRAAEAALAAARTDLEQTVKQAWAKAHVVRLNEVQAKIMERVDHG